MRVPAPAKINLHLRVGPPKADGFHPLLTWMTTVALFDTLTFVRRRPTSPTSDDAGDSPTPPQRDAHFFALSCDRPDLPVGRDNLVVKAAMALADAAGTGDGSRVGEGSTVVRLDRVSAFLAKRIPSGAGLGGGSSDAAAALVGLNALWKLGFAASRLSAIAAQLGSDVPFFLSGPSSVCSGRGEIVRPVARLDMKWAVLVLPKYELPTPAVYRRFDEMNLGREDSIRDDVDWAAWSKLSAAELMPRLVNDMEPAAFSLRPELGELRQKLERELSPQIVRMSGSGSSLFTLCDDAERAQSLAQRVKQRCNVDAMAAAVAPEVKLG